MRARNIKPGFFKNDLLAECSPLARLLFAGLWCLADREGRLEDRPLRIKAELLPYDACDVDALLGELAGRRFLVRYEVAGKRYVEIPKFARHQKPHHKEQPSTVPPPPKAGGPTGPVQGAAAPLSGASTDLGTCEHRPRHVPVSADSLFSDSGIRIPEETDAGASVCPETAEPSSGPTATPEVFLEFPCVGKTKTWPLTVAQVAEWQELFPGLDVRHECRKARAWLFTDPQRRKTFRGMPRFLFRWLGRAQDDRGPPLPKVQTNGKPRKGETAADVFAARRRERSAGGEHDPG